jgi:uncharacterized protein with von Willebrand factor type A (vWA) domain
MRGEQGMGMGDATTALEELADLDDLESALGQDYPGRLARRRRRGGGAAGARPRRRRRRRRAAPDRARAARAGLPRPRRAGRLELSPRAVRRVGATALRKVFSKLEAGGRGGHDVQDAGPPGETTGASRAWQFGDEQPLDVVRTVRNAVLRAGRSDDGVRLHVEDFEVVETERRTSAAVALLVDLSFSMELRGTWGTAKQTALALHSLVTTKYPQDSIEIIGFSDYAQVLTPERLAGLDAQRVQGTNLQHALVLAGRPPGQAPRQRAGRAGRHRRRADGPPDAQRLRGVLLATAAGDARADDGGGRAGHPARRDDQRLHARRRAAPGRVRRAPRRAQRRRVFSPDPERLGEYVVSDYLRARRGRRGR